MQSPTNERLFQGERPTSSLLKLYREEPLWHEVPVCTVHCKEQHVLTCPDNEHFTQLFDRSIDLSLSKSCIDFIKYSVGEDWELMASDLGFTETEMQHLKDTYLLGKKSLHEEHTTKLPGFVFLLEAMIRQALTHKNMSSEEILEAIEKNGNFNKHFFPFRQINDQVKLQVKPYFENTGRYTSYIFLIWIKKDKTSSILPNTVDCPVKQRCYDWAQHNKDKLVVLWFSSSMLDSTKAEQDVFYEFQKNTLSDGIKNILVLDIDNIKWGDEERYTYQQGKAKISETLVFNKDLPFSEVIDGLRPVLLSRGSTYIKSAMQQSHIPEADVPSRGAYFDVDYIPVPFKSFYHPYRKICRDGTFDKIFFNYGSLRVGGMVPNSFLATYEDNNDFITEYPMCSAYGNLSFYTDYRPHLISTTRLFRMSDCKYSDNGALIDWERQTTWQNDYADETCTETLSANEPPPPSYLSKYKETESSKTDPMIQN